MGFEQEHTKQTAVFAFAVGKIKFNKMDGHHGLIPLLQLLVLPTITTATSTYV